MVSPGIYNAETGECLNTPAEQNSDSLDSHWQMQRSSRGSELFLKGTQVITGGRMLYSEKQDGIASRYEGNYSLQASDENVVIRGNAQSIERVVPGATAPDQSVLWKRSWFQSSDAIVVAENAVIVAGQMEDVTQNRKTVPAILAMDIKDGSVLWSHRLPQRAVSWGLAVTRTGRLVISMVNGDVACLAEAGGN